MTIPPSPVHQNVAQEPIRYTVLQESEDEVMSMQNHCQKMFSRKHLEDRYFEFQSCLEMQIVSFSTVSQEKAQRQPILTSIVNVNISFTFFISQDHKKLKDKGKSSSRWMQDMKKWFGKWNASHLLHDVSIYFFVNVFFL